MDAQPLLLKQVKVLTNMLTPVSSDDEVTLIYVVGGQGQITITGHAFAVNPGMLLVANTGDKYWIGSASGKITVAILVFSYELLLSNFGIEQLYVDLQNASSNQSVTELKALIDQMLDVYFDDVFGKTTLVSGLTELLAYRLVNNFSAHSDAIQVSRMGGAENRKQKIQAYIARNYNETISLQHLADYLYITPAYLSRYFKQEFGKTFLEYLNDIRLINATKQLTRSRNNVTKIALANGFASSSAFTRAFKKIYHTTPSEYRRTAQRRTKEEDRHTSQQSLAQVKQFLQTQSQQATNVDIEQVHANLNRYQMLEPNWNQLLNLGPARLLLDSVVKEQVGHLCDDLGFTDVRVWNVIALTAFRDERTHQLRLNFDKLDRALDFLIDKGLRPYLVMIDKPDKLMVNNRIQRTRARQSDRFGSLAEYATFLNAFMSHLTHRYTQAAVNTWHFEYWYDLRQDFATEAVTFYQVFKTAYRIIKQETPAAQVGGPGVLLGFQDEALVSFFEQWREQAPKPDFLTVYSYQYADVTMDNKMSGKRTLDDNFLNRRLGVLQAILKQIRFVITDVHVSEWNFTISNRCAINDSCGQACYIVRNCLQVDSRAQLLGYWHATDLLSESYDTSPLLFGDSGLYTKNSIRKPAYYAFMFLNRLYHRVHYRDERCIVTSNDRGDITILVNNYKRLSHRFLAMEEDEITVDQQDGLYEDTDELTIELTVDGLMNDEYLMKRHTVNREYGSIQTLWRKLNYVDQFEREEMHYLSNVSMPDIQNSTINVLDGSVRLKLKLAPFEISLIKIERGHQ